MVIMFSIFLYYHSNSVTHVVTALPTLERVKDVLKRLGRL